MREIDRLRQEAKNLRRNTTAKIGRIRRNFNIDVANTQNDPRVPSDAIDKMTARQVRSYIRKNRDFLSRDVGFVPGANGAILPLREWRVHERLRERFNKIADANHAQFKDLKVPGSRNTVGEREKLLEDRLTMRQAAMNRPMRRIDRESTDIPSAKALTKLTRDLQKRLDPNHKKKAMSAARKQATQMLKRIGSKDLSGFVSGLTEKQFEFMWFYGSLANDLSTRYTGITESAIHRLDKGFENVTAEIAEETIADFRQALRDQGI